MRFLLRDALRPLELALLSLGARVEESLSTRLDSVRAPDLLCVSRDRLDLSRDRLDPVDLFRELAFARRFDDEEERPLDFDEEPVEPPERALLLLDRELRWGILPLLLDRRSVRDARLPNPNRSNTQLGGSRSNWAGSSNFTSAGSRGGPPARKAQLARKPKERR